MSQERNRSRSELKINVEKKKRITSSDPRVTSSNSRVLS